MSNKLKLYALSTCVHCRHTREFLDESKVDYDCIYVDKLKGDERDKIINEVKMINPAVSFPTLIFRDKVIVGFKRDQIEEILDL